MNIWEIVASNYMLDTNTTKRSSSMSRVESQFDKLSLTNNSFASAYTQLTIFYTYKSHKTLLSHMENSTLIHTMMIIMIAYMYVDSGQGQATHIFCKGCHMRTLHKVCHFSDISTILLLRYINRLIG